MKKSYPLNLFYQNAKNLIEKHHVAKAGHKLEARFEIGDIKGSPQLNCVVNYGVEYQYKFYGAGDTPETALIFFEKDILREKGESHLEDVTVEIPEKQTYQLITSSL